MTSWCGQKPKLTAEQVAEVRRIAAAKRALPTWADLSRRWGVAPETVRNASKPDKFKRYNQTIGTSP